MLAKEVGSRNHTIPILEVERLKGGVVLVMPLAVPLSQVDPGRLTSELVRQLIEGVQFMHEKGVAHLDLKPSNLVLVGGRLHIIDFGLAQLCLPNQVLRGFRGTPGWVAPEVVREEDFDPVSADLWATGRIIEDFLDRMKKFDCSGRSSGSSRSSKLDEEIRWIRSMVSDLMHEDPKRRCLFFTETGGLEGHSTQKRRCSLLMETLAVEEARHTKKHRFSLQV